MPKTIVITGASDGIGAAGARALGRAGHAVVIVGRSPEKTRAVAAELGADSLVADFAKLDEVRALAAELGARYPRIDVLANNAGGVFGDRARTVDGFELTLQVNHLAPFLLTGLLLDTLIASRATVIQTSSAAARLYGHLDLDDLGNDWRYSANKAYGDAKLENILFTRELHRRCHDRGISAVAFHPGVIATSFATGTTSSSMRFLYASPLAKLLLPGPEKGADQLVWLSETTPGDDWQPGEYYEKRRIARRVNPQVRDADLARRLWDVSATMTGLAG